MNESIESKNVESPTEIALADSLTEDPEYKAIRAELSDAWVEKNGQDKYSADYQDFVYGYGIGKEHIKTLDQLTLQRFTSENPELVQGYKKQEQTKVYDSYKNDPKYREYEEDATVQGNLAAQRYPKLDSDGVRQSELMSAMDNFVRNYPEKAAAYAEDNQNIADALDRLTRMHEDLKEREEEARREREEWLEKGRQQKLQMARARLAELVPGYKQPESSSVEDDVEAVQSKEVEPMPVIVENPEELRSSIQETIPEEVKFMTREDFNEKQESLKELPFLPAKSVSEILDLQGENEGAAFIEVKSIIGSVSPAFEDWSTEYDQRKGRAVDVAMTLTQGDSDGYERMFHTQDPERGIRVKKFSAPKGDMFFVKDGNHRVAGAKLAEAGEIPVQVENMNTVNEMVTESEGQAREWEERIQAGFMKGEVVEDVNSSGKKTYRLEITEQILPWAALPQQKFLEMTKMYKRLYPEALTGLKNLKTNEEIPVDALLDEIAMNYYLLGRWEEYENQG